METACQLESLGPDVARNLTRTERILRVLGKIVHRTSSFLKKLFSPVALTRKAKTVLHLPVVHAVTDGIVTEPPAQATPIKVPPLGLQAGELVRVKSYEEILKTLDANRRYEGCSFMTHVMRPHCGKTYRVVKRIEHFFDERTWRMLKPKNMVILEGVHCQSSPSDHVEWSGCDRMCYLFWKEAWLERV